MSRRESRDRSGMVVRVRFEQSRLAPLYLAEAYERIVPPASRLSVGSVHKRSSEPVETVVSRVPVGAAA